MEWLGSTILRALWRPTVNVDKISIPCRATEVSQEIWLRRKIWSGGLLPRLHGRRLPTPEYRPANVWTERKALFGQNDYIDILGTGEIHPVKTLYTVPSWIRGISGHEYHILLRKKKMFANTGSKQIRPTKWKELEKRLSFLYRKLNRKTKTGQSPD